MPCTSTPWPPMERDPPGSDAAFEHRLHSGMSYLRPRPRHCDRCARSRSPRLPVADRADQAQLQRVAEPRSIADRRPPRVTRTAGHSSAGCAGGARPFPLSGRLEVVAIQVVGNLSAEGDSLHVRGPEVDAAPHARVDDLLERE